MWSACHDPHNPDIALPHPSRQEHGTRVIMEFVSRTVPGMIRANRPGAGRAGVTDFRP